MEVNLAKSLKGTVLINGERYFISYEGLTTICSKCGMYGHLVHSCPQGATEKMVVLRPSNVGEESKEAVAGRDGFTAVRRSRRGNASRIPVVAVTDRTEAEERRNLRANPSSQGRDNITLSNRFGSLGEGTIPTELREVVNLVEENKENEDIFTKQSTGLSGKPGRGDRIWWTECSKELGQEWG